jgi:uncharacterized membrane protein
VRVLRFGAVASLLLLIALSLAWELWLAPLRPGGSWLMLKAVPLLAPLRGILHGRRYVYQWASLLILPYFAEGIVRGAAEPDPSRLLAMAEAALSLVFFLCVIAYARLSGRASAR